MPYYKTYNPPKYTYIYGLVDPSSEKIKYVGKSDNPENRFIEHIERRGYGSGRKKVKWLDGLISNNQKPKLVILEKCLSSQAKDRETYWIAKVAASGIKLVNENGVSKTIKLKLPDKLWGNIVVNAYNENETIENMIIKLLDNSVDK